jgi:hypothetical protein
MGYVVQNMLGVLLAGYSDGACLLKGKRAYHKYLMALVV